MPKFGTKLGNGVKVQVYFSRTANPSEDETKLLDRIEKLVQQKRLRGASVSSEIVRLLKLGLDADEAQTKADRKGE